MQEKAAQQERQAVAKPKRLLDKLRLTQLDEMSKTRAPLIVNLLLYGGSFGLVALSGLTMACSGYYTPAHTNSFSVVA